mmetsp:Transcript_11183/g.25423  ORF Transcript_11183/g.25423 Transcript_11183/m.25423 type:complete len:1119 (+) Transcript_11183:54-3410(+)
MQCATAAAVSASRARRTETFASSLEPLNTKVSRSNSGRPDGSMSLGPWSPSYPTSATAKSPLDLVREKSPTKVEQILQEVADVHHMQREADEVLRSLSDGQNQIKSALAEVWQVVSDLQTLAGSSNMMPGVAPSQSPRNRRGRSPAGVMLSRGSSDSLPDGRVHVRSDDLPLPTGSGGPIDAFAMPSVDFGHNRAASKSRPDDVHYRAPSPVQRKSFAEVHISANSTLERGSGELAQTYDMDHHLSTLSSSSSSTIGDAPQQQSVRADFASDRKGTNTTFRKTVSSAAKSIADMAGVLPEAWPASIEMRFQGPSPLGDVVSMTTSTSFVFAALDSERGSESDGNRRRMCSCCRYLVIDPNWKLCVLYDCLSVLLLLFDITAVPVVLAWDLQPKGAIGALTWFTTAFWSWDVMFNFLRGYHEGGELQRDPVVVATRYLRTFFVPDIAIVLTDWLAILTNAVSDSRSSNMGGVKLFRIAKVGRLLRVFGMIRVLKYAKVVDDIVDRVFSGTGFIVIRIAAVVAAIVWFNHLMACAWFSMGMHGPTDTGLRWPDTNPATLGNGFAYEYWTCAHWAMAQTVLGAIEIPSSNTLERAFTVLCLLMGLLVGSSLVSSLSASMVEFQITRQERAGQMRVLRAYLRDSKVSSSLAYRVQRQVTERLSQKGRTTEKDVVALQLISLPLRITLRVEMYSPVLCRHPLFWLWSQLHVGMIRALCAHGVYTRFLRPKDQLTTPGSMADLAHITISGTLMYHASATQSLPPYERSPREHLGSGTWIAEATLWTYWTYVGTTCAEESCELVCVDPDVVSKMLTLQGLVGDMSFDYRRIFHTRLLESCPPYSPWPTDVRVPYADFADIAHSFGLEHKVLLGETVLDHEAQKAWRSQNQLTEIYEELEKRSPVLLVPLLEGGFERVILSVAVRCENSDGRVLVQIGRHDNTGGMTALCQLPTVKQEGGESPRDTLEKLFVTRLYPCRSALHLVEVSREAVVRKKMSYRRTNQITTIFKFRKDGEFDDIWSCTKDYHIAYTNSTTSSRKSFGSHFEEPVLIVPIADRKSRTNKGQQRVIYTWVRPDILSNLDKDTTAFLPLLQSIPFDSYLEYEASLHGGPVCVADSDLEFEDLV